MIFAQKLLIIIYIMEQRNFSLFVYLKKKKNSQEDIDAASEDIMKLGLLSVSGSDALSITELPVFVSFGHKLLQEWCGAYFIEKNIQKVGDRIFVLAMNVYFALFFCVRSLISDQLCQQMSLSLLPFATKLQKLYFYRCYPFELNLYRLHILETTGFIFSLLDRHRKTARSGEVPLWSYARPYTIGGSRLSDVDWSTASTHKKQRCPSTRNACGGIV